RTAQPASQARARPAIVRSRSLRRRQSLGRRRREEVDAAVTQARHLVDAPFGQHAGEILALVRATAFSAPQGSLRNYASAKQHVAQVEPVDTTHIEALAIAERLSAEFPNKIVDASDGAF